MHRYIVVVWATEEVDGGVVGNQVQSLISVVLIVVVPNMTSSSRGEAAVGLLLVLLAGGPISWSFSLGLAPRAGVTGASKG